MTQPPEDLSFLARPGDAADWRYVVLWDAARQSGLLGALPATASDAARSAGLDEHGARVVLDALVAWNALREHPGGTYDLAPGAVDDEGSAVLAHHARAIATWTAHLADALRGARGPGGGLPPDRERWLQALGVRARRAAPAMVDACLARAPHARSVLELGGGHGEYGREFARRGLSVTMQDLPGTIEIVRRWGIEGDGLELFPGDFFERLPDRAFDLVFCAGITHTFDAEHNRSLYGRVAGLLAPDGVLAIATFLRNRNVASRLFAIQMLLVGDGADTHSEEEYRSWVVEAGFRTVEVVDLPGAEHTLLTATC